MSVYVHPMAPRRYPLPLCGRCQRSVATAEVRWPDDGRIWALVLVCDDCLAGALQIGESMATTVEVVEYYPADAGDDQGDQLAPAARLTLAH